MSLYVSLPRVRTAVLTLQQWRSLVDSQGAKHLIHFLSSKRNGVNSTEFKPHAESDDLAFCETVLRVKPGTEPYYDPLDGAFRIHTHHHRNIATARKKTFSAGWKAASMEVRDGKEFWKFSPDYVEILAQKMLTKAGQMTRIPVYDLCAWIYRNEDFPESTTLRDVGEKLKNDYHITEEEFSKLFTTSRSDGTEEPAKAFFTHVPPKSAILVEMLTNPEEFDMADALAEQGGTDSVQSITAEDIQQMLVGGRRQIILQGPPGTGKTYLSKLAATHVLNVPLNKDADFTMSSLYIDVNTHHPDTLPEPIQKNGGWTLVQFHPSYTYEDFVRGITASIEKGSPVFSVRDKTFALLCRLAEKIRPNPVVLIIDEINRGDLSKVLGELVYGLEYRDKPITLQYADASARFSIPNNLFILATMNTADRSIAHVDYAIRRRFDFVDVLPDRSVVARFHGDTKIRDGALALFDGTSDLVSHSPQYAIGHSFFLERTAESLARSFVFQVLPLLAEYRVEGILGETDSIILPKWTGSKGVPFKHEKPFQLVKAVTEWIETFVP